MFALFRVVFNFTVRYWLFASIFIQYSTELSCSWFRSKTSWAILVTLEYDYLSLVVPSLFPEVALFLLKSFDFGRCANSTHPPLLKTDYLYHTNTNLFNHRSLIHFCKESPFPSICPILVWIGFLIVISYFHESFIFVMGYRGRHYSESSSSSRSRSRSREARESHSKHSRSRSSHSHRNPSNRNAYFNNHYVIYIVVPTNLGETFC